MYLVTVRLPCLCQQDERSGVGRLEAESEVEQDEGIDVEIGDTHDVQSHPDGDENRLRDQEGRRAEEAGEGLGLQGEPIIAEDAAEMQMRPMKPVEMVGLRVVACSRCLACRRHRSCLPVESVTIRQCNGAAGNVSRLNFAGRISGGKWNST